MKSLFKTTLFAGLLVINCTLAAVASEPDSAYIFSYATDKNFNKNGLHFAWSIDQVSWHPIGPEHSYLRCDYGTWGAQKRMLTPVLFRDAKNSWHCVWSVNSEDGVFAHSTSKNLVDWKPQKYPIVMEKGNCLLPELAYDYNTGEFIITWISSGIESDSASYRATTHDFIHLSPSRKIPEASRQNMRVRVDISGKPEIGTVHKVEWQVIDNLIKAQQLAAHAHQLNSENAQTDSVRFRDLETVEASFSLDHSKQKSISSTLMGVFFEDINYAADGGLYAELIQNRGFEYDLSDKKGRDTTWTHTKTWSVLGKNGSIVIDSVSPLHENNKHYALIEGGSLVNEGFDGIPLKAGEKYRFSVFCRQMEGKPDKLAVHLIGNKGEVYAQSTTPVISGSWRQYEVELTSKATVDDARLEIKPKGKVALDMISLFPEKTFKGRKNGLRPDLAQAIADLKPSFVRFPGGCVAHGDGLGNIYRWKNTIGPLEARVPQRNLWGYHQSYGLGYFEYFQFCEDIGAEPLPVVAAGVPCQNSSAGGAGQQCGIPMDEMGDYVQEVLDLIEYANGDITTPWGKKRAEAGHPEPFNLKYIGIGNEDLISHVFEERFTLIYEAVAKKHPEITIIGTVGPFSEGSDYREGWEIANKLEIPIVDEHYYRSPGWFINNQDFYDRYDRTASKVYLGEYASWGNALYNALAEAIYLTAIERNGEVVTMTSYAPLLAKEKHTQWSTDLIFFNNTEVKPTVNYHVQRLFGEHTGDIYIPHTLHLSTEHGGVRERIAASVVKDSKTNDVIVKLVNILPVAVNSSIDLQGMGVTGNDAQVTLLSGKPDDKELSPKTSTISVSNMLKAELPPYSLTVIRLNTKGDL